MSWSNVVSICVIVFSRRRAFVASKAGRESAVRRAASAFATLRTSPGARRDRGTRPEQPLRGRRSSEQGCVGQLLRRDAIARELHGEHGDRHANRDFVQANLVGTLGADSHVAGESHERAAGERVTGAGDDERDLRGVESEQELRSAGEKILGRCWARHHDTQVEARAEAVRAAHEHHRAGFLLGACKRPEEAFDHDLRERVRLAVVHPNDRDVAFERVLQDLGCHRLVR